MKHDVVCDVPTSAKVLNIDASDVAPFLRKCVKDRSLSTLVKDLNDAVLFGTADQRRDAEQALKHIGFM